jgi:hypothetical protein
MLSNSLATPREAPPLRNSRTSPSPDLPVKKSESYEAGAC